MITRPVFEPFSNLQRRVGPFWNPRRKHLGTLLQRHLRFSWLTFLGFQASEGHAQIFIRESTWGLVEPPQLDFAGLVELVSGLLLLQVGMLLFSGILMRKKWRLARKVPRLERRLDHLTARRELRERIQKGSKLLTWVTYLLAPLSGLAGVILGAPFVIGPVDVAAIMALIAMIVLGVGAVTLSRIKRMVAMVPQVKISTP